MPLPHSSQRETEFRFVGSQTEFGNQSSLDSYGKISSLLVEAWLKAMTVATSKVKAPRL
jgi:hypothetical protein